MTNEIELLHASLLDDQEKLKEISYWLKVMNRPNGWHYDLDQIWLLNGLENAGISPGATVLDAGAGQGIMQYLLASRGYNVISLDFSPRTRPGHSIGVFDVEGDGSADIEYQHSYMSFISYGTQKPNSLFEKFSITHLRKVFKLPRRISRGFFSTAFYLFERLFGDHRKYGRITYLRAPFHDIPLAAKSVDAVISISAIEHSDINLFQKNISELLRVLKNRSPLLLTTSATTCEKNTYLEKYAGWCFSLSGLKTLFPGHEINFDTKLCTQSILESDVFVKRIASYYYEDSNSFCYKKRIKHLPYLPVAVKIIK